MYKVFLAEDEIVVREGIRNNIPWAETPYSLVGEAPDGEIALSMIQDIRPDILITDIRMPFLDGLTLSRIVKKTLPWIKIIILSGHDEFEYAREAISVGVEEYLLKPVSSQEMLKTLDKIAKRIEESDFDPSPLLGIKDDLFLTRLKYAANKDIDSIIQEYSGLLGDSFAENQMLVFFVFGEILVAASKIVEALGGDIKKIVPFSLNRDDIQYIASSREVFHEKVKTLLSAVIEYRDANTDGRYKSVIIKAREYIDENFTSAEMSLFSTASHVGISPNHLSTVFTQETGEHFIEYLTRTRIEKAKQLLLDTAMKGVDIAYETGFSDPHYFSSIFKKNTGFSPREFRLSKLSKI
ncbi:MAG: response regulator [Treponema sp.]|jgi:two-component system response regulator YesN|nr:response regulator [Treponema sp.]